MGETFAIRLRKCKDCECGYRLEISEGREVLKGKIIKTTEKERIMKEVNARLLLFIEGKADKE